MSYTTSELLQRFQSEIDDSTDEDSGTAEERLMVSTDDALSYLNEAQMRFARETLYFVDSTTPEITQIRAVADDPWVDFDERILEVYGADWATTNRAMDIRDQAEMRQGWVTDDYGVQGTAAWRTETGTPRFLVLGMDTRRIRLVPIPSAAGTIELTVARLPLCPIRTIDDAVEIREDDYQLLLLLWMKHRAYSKEDADIYDQQRAAPYRAEFDFELNRVRSAMRKRRRNTPSVRYGGIGGYEDVSAFDVVR